MHSCTTVWYDTWYKTCKATVIRWHLAPQENSAVSRGPPVTEVLFVASVLLMFSQGFGMRRLPCGDKTSKVFGSFRMHAFLGRQRSKMYQNLFLKMWSLWVCIWKSGLGLWLFSVSCRWLVLTPACSYFSAGPPSPQGCMHLVTGLQVPLTAVGPAQLLTAPPTPLNGGENRKLVGWEKDWETACQLPSWAKETWLYCQLS